VPATFDPDCLVSASASFEVQVSSGTFVDEGAVPAV
jgi:hypothetical protein